MTVLQRLASQVPPPVVEVCGALQKAGHEAVTVGGAVRDVILGREPGDWDVATSARPEEVRKLFRRTIPTGIEHGTITVVVSAGKERYALEVTTYRGEGAYSDGRRPDSVEFGVPLKEDLARRDFVCNAVAYDPLAQSIHDPFGGVADIEKRSLRAVGNPAERFAEDGLRIMRAVRFVATLGFTLEPATERALGGALASLAKVSQERVRVELEKLLAAAAPGPALDIFQKSGIAGVVLPELPADWAVARDRAVRMPPDPPLRLGALLLGVSQKTVDAAMRRLTLSNVDRARVCNLVERGTVAPSIGDAELRQTLGFAGRDKGAPELVALWRADGKAALASRAEAILAARDPLTIGELAIRGEDLLGLGVPKGPEIGEILKRLLDEVLTDPTQNQRERLLERVRAMRA